MKIINFFFILFCTLIVLPYSTAMTYEEANYNIVVKNEIYEIRKYSNRLAIETIENDQNSGFRKLFKYISGNNQSNQKIKMTTPVTRVKKNGNMTMQFYYHQNLMKKIFQTHMMKISI